jgi:hypothetical protein
MTTNILPDKSYYCKGRGQNDTSLSIEIPGWKQQRSVISVVRYYRTPEAQSSENLSTVRFYRTVEISNAIHKWGHPPFV